MITLFDVYAVGALAERLAPLHGAELARLWRAKQLEYTWLQSLMAGVHRRDDFDRITAHAMDFAVAALGLPLGADEKLLLRGAYRTLAAFPDARGALEALAPRPRWILSNGTLAGINPLVRHNGLEALLDGVLSVDAVGVYKPAPQVYALAADRLCLPPGRIGFVSSNCWMRSVLARSDSRRSDQPYRRTARSARPAAATYCSRRSRSCRLAPA
jgi:2-haloacid dehalogenase